MSFHDLAVTVSAKNQASAEFAQVVTDANQMATEIDTASSAMASSFQSCTEEVNALGTEAEASGTTIESSFQACTVEVNNLGVEAVVAAESIQVGFQMAGEEIDLTSDKIKISSANVKEFTRDLAVIGGGIYAVGRLGEAFGFLNREQASCINMMGLTLSAVGGIIRAFQIFTSSTAIATAVQNALNISYATFLALTGVGIAVIVAAAAAMWYFSSQMNTATASIKNYNAAASEVPVYTRGIQRAGDESLRRRGIE